MEVYTVRAASLQEALQRVRDSLGPNASVLQTREVRPSRFGLLSRKLVEVEATVDIAAVRRVGGDGPLLTPQVAAKQRRTVPQNATAEKSSAWPSTPDAQSSATLQLNEPSGVDGSRPLPSNSTSSSSSPRAAASSHTDRSSHSQREAAGMEELTPALFEVLSELLDGEVDPEMARRLVTEATQAMSSYERQDPWLIRGKLGQIIAASLRVSGSLELSRGRQQIVALVGPTGVGKTTTLAKIAAGFRFDLGCKVGLITLDTFRLGAVDQLLQYAELISAPLEVVSSPDQVGGALERLRECDLILLDTAGRSPKDTDELRATREFLRSAQPSSTHLVLSATSSPAYARLSLEKYALLEPTHLLISKLDEAVHFGNWLALLQRLDMPISYLTTGQHVPDDIAVASTRRLAALLLGHHPHMEQVV